MLYIFLSFFFFFFNDTATTEIYTLSYTTLFRSRADVKTAKAEECSDCATAYEQGRAARNRDRKSTRLNSSHGYISYAVFCLKKKKKHTDNISSCPSTILCTLELIRDQLCMHYRQ